MCVDCKPLVDDLGIVWKNSPLAPQEKPKPKPSFTTRVIDAAFYVWRDRPLNADFTYAQALDAAIDIALNDPEGKNLD